MDDNKREIFAEQLGALGLGMLILIAALGAIDYSTQAGFFEKILELWRMLPVVLRIVLFSGSCGLIVIFGLFYWMVRSAVPVDENECPIQKKGKQ